MLRPKFLFLYAIALISFIEFAARADCPVGDVHEDDDCRVNWLDLQDFAEQWLNQGCSAPSCRADLDGIPGVNMNDFVLLAANWMKGGKIPLVINEVMAGNDNTIEDPDYPGDYPDWFEIYNYGYEDIDIAGLWVRDDSTAHWHQIQPGTPQQSTIVPARGHLLLWADGEPQRGPRHVDFGLGKSSDEVGLYDQDKEPIDVVAFTNQEDDKSYGRLPDGADNWITFEIGGATPGSRNLRNPIEVVISEIMYHPGHAEGEAENVGLEYIELYNKGQDPVSLGGWRFVNGVNFVIPGEPILAVAECFVIAADIDEFRAKYPDVTNVEGGWDGKLSNAGENIELTDSYGVLMDQVRYSDQGEWAVRQLGPRDRGHRGWEWSEAHDGGGKSLELINPELPNDHGQNWAATESGEGTPGTINTVNDDDIAPLIIDVENYPIIPDSNDSVTVTAEIIDEASAGVSVTLHYRIDRSTYQDGNEDIYPQHDPNDYNDVPMYDDGAHGDGLSEDGIYGAEIPPQGDGLVVEFYVESADAAENTRTWPPPSMMFGEPNQVTNALYQVDDEFNSTTWTAGDQPVYYLIMTAMEKGRLLDIGDPYGSEANSDAQMNLTFVSVDGVETKVRHRASVRNRGHGSRNDPPNNYRVNFPHDRKWEGVDSINLNTKYTYLQVIGNALFRLSGVVSPEAKPVQVRLNGDNYALPGMTGNGNVQREMYGSYVHMEVVDGDFASNHFPDDDAGNAYKCMRISGYADLGYEGTDPAAYSHNYLKRTNTAANDYSKLIELCRVLDPIQTPDANYIEEVNRVANVEQWLRFLAVNTVLNNSETTLANGNGDDYYIYDGVEDPRFVLIQHDLDSILGLGDGLGTGYPTDGIFRFIIDPRNPGIPALERLVWHPEHIHRYYWHLKDLIETIFSPEQLGPVLEDLIGDFVPPAVIQQMMDFATVRKAHILSQIPSDLTVVSDLPKVSGYHATNADVAFIYGKADVIKTRSVLVNGSPAIWDPVWGDWIVAEPPAPDYETIVPKGAMWKYFDQYTDLGPDWYLDIDDSTWAQGNAELGYGDGTEDTQIGYIVTNPGTPEEGKNITTYFTHSFEVPDKSKYLALSLRVRRDDGAVVYLNETEIARSNMPEGAVDYYTPAAGNVYGNDPQGGDVETLYYGGAVYDNDDDFTNIAVGLLRNGTNVLAVEIHQYQNNGADISFDLELKGRLEQSAPTVGVSLNPGINRVIVQAFEGPDGTGKEIDREHIDIWYDDGDESTVSGTIPTTRFLAAASGPWHVTGDIVVPSGKMLLVQPGTTLFFDPGTGITVQPGGRLFANGGEYSRIRLTAFPGGANWNGIKFDGTLETNQLTYLDHEFGDAQGESVDVQNAKLIIDNVTWSGTNTRVLNIDHPSVICRNSVFPSISSTEPVHGVGLTGDEYLVFDGCIFGTASGYNDIIDFTYARRPGPVFQIYNSLFIGGGDDGVDLDSVDAHIEGNVFLNFHGGGGDGTSNAVSTGDEGWPSELYVARNIFINNDHAVLLKEDSFMHAHNNVFMDSNVAVVVFGEPYRNPPREPGRGANMKGNIFLNNAAMFEHFFEDPLPTYGPTGEVVIDRSMLPWQWHYLGAGNIDGDPLFVDVGAGDFRLKADSGALGTGAWGLDMGAMVPAGAAISGEPGPVTYRTNASLKVNGPGIVSYKYSVNSPTGPWSIEKIVALPILLTGLTNGESYTVYAIGKNSAGVWQSEHAPAVSRTWTVDTSHSELMISEVLAHTHGNEPDIVELYYDGPQSIDLLGMSLTDDPTEPEKFVFTLTNVFTTVINPGQHMFFFAAVPPVAGTRNYLGFGLSADGEALYLYDKPNPDGSRDLIDSVVFGPQINDYSISRVGYDREWKLSKMTFGAENIAQPLGDPDTLKINEWLADGEVLFDEDFVELYNPHPLPVSLGGMYMTDDPIMRPDKHRIPDLSFIPPQGYSVFLVNDGNEPSELDFKLSPDGEMIGLFDAQLNLIDQVLYTPQTTDVSHGRAPDGDPDFEFFQLPTPGVANSYINTEVIRTALAPEDADKYVFVPTSPNDVGETWNSDTDFNDSAWMTCIGAPGGIGYEADTGYETMITLDLRAQMEDLHTTCYVRIPFTVDAEDLAGYTGMTLKLRYDDGCIVYLNGVEITEARLNFDPADTPAWDSDADGNHEASGLGFDALIDITDYIGDLRAGDNLLAIHGLNISSGSSDFLISAELEAATTIVHEENPYEEDLDVLAGLRITELMYNAPGGSSYDFIELKNVSNTPIQLEGVRFLEGVLFEFPSRLLVPGQIVVVVSNLTAFNTFYGFGADVIGEYTGGFGGGGEKIVLTLAWPLDAAIMRFEYDDAWYPTTDGAGHSLHIIDPKAHPAAWNEPQSWNPAFPTPGY